MAQRFENRFRSSLGQDIFFQSWISDKADQTIVLTHGLAEHSECYDTFAQKMGSSGFNIYAWDLMGHGRSEGKRGYVKSFADFVTTHQEFIQIVQSEMDSKDSPLILFGHSMGGLITILSQLENPTTNCQALCLSSPALGYAINVPAFKDKMARIANKWLPTLTLFNEISYSDLTRDAEYLKAYPVDSLRHDKICPAIYLGMIAGFETVAARAQELSLPILFQIAGNDKVVSANSSKRVFEKIASENKRLEMYTESYHEIFNDLEREHCYEDLRNFLKENL